MPLVILGLSSVDVNNDDDYSPAVWRDRAASLAPFLARSRTRHSEKQLPLSWRSIDANSLRCYADRGGSISRIKISP